MKNKTKLYLYDIPTQTVAVEHVLSIDYYQNKKLTSLSINNGIMLPAQWQSYTNFSWAYGGVLDESFHYVEESSIPSTHNGRYRLHGAYEFDAVIHSEAKVVYFGMFMPHWGHFILEWVVRLWFVIENINILDDYKLAYTSPQNDDITGIYLEFLECCGIKKSHLLKVTVPTQFSEIIVPDLSMSMCAYYTNEYINLFDHVIKNAMQTNIDCEKFDKIFLQTRVFSKDERKDIGNEEIISFFKSNGYQLINTSQYSLKELIYILQNCTHCACIDGSLPHDMIFARNNTNLTIIKKFSRINALQGGINQARSLNVTYIDSHSTIFPSPWGNGPFLLTISEQLGRFAKDNKMNLPRRLQNENNNFLEYMHKYFIFCNKIGLSDGGWNDLELLQETYEALHDKMNLNFATYDSVDCKSDKINRNRSRFLCTVKKLSYEFVYIVTRSEKYKSKYLKYKRLLQV